MKFTRERLEKKARHWEAQSLNDVLAGREPTPMITVEMPTTQWEQIWMEDATQALYEALKGLVVAYNVSGEGIRLDDDLVYWQCAVKALALADREVENDR